MRQDTKPGIAISPRHVYGPRPIGTLIPSLTRPAFRRISPAAAQLMADWPSIIGPALAAVTTPQRFSAGQLTVACSGPIAMELQHLTTELIARINTHLGGSPVKRLRFVQTHSPTLAATPVPPPQPDPAAAQAAEAAVASVRQGDLRAALARLGQAVISAESRTKS